MHSKKRTSFTSQGPSQSDPASWQCSTICCAAASFGWYTFREIWRDTKMHWWLYRFEAGELLSSRNSQAIRKMAKGPWYNRGIFRALRYFYLFLNKDWILQKEAQNFVVHLLLVIFGKIAYYISRITLFVFVNCENKNVLFNSRHWLSRIA